MFLELLVFILILLLVRYRYILRFLYLTSKIPKSSYNTSLSNIWKFLSGDTKVIFDEICNALKDVKGVTKTWIGPTAVVNITSPEDLQIVLNAKECTDKPYFMKLFGRPRSSLFGDIDSWRQHRKILNPYFGNYSLRIFIPNFNEKVHTMMKNMRRREGGGEFNVFCDLFALALETTLASMELDVDIQNREDKEFLVEYLDNFDMYGEVITLRLCKIWLHPDKIFALSRLSRSQNKALSKVDCFSPEIIKKASAAVAEQKHSEARAKTFIQALVDPKNRLSTREIFDEISSMVVAALDTTALISSSALLLLAMHKEKQEKVVTELRQVIGEWSENLYIDIEQLNQLSYLEMVINEAMRLMPALPLVFRTNEEEITLNGGFVIPAQSNLLIPIFHMHKNKELWGADADEFRPERFEREKFSKIHPYAFVPFVKGPRMCVGWRYAMLSLKIQLANILLRYEVDTRLRMTELEYKLTISMNVCQGYVIAIKERENVKQV